MLLATTQIKTLKYKLKKIERVNGEFRTGEQDIKFLQSPRKSYAYLHNPNKGTQVLWIADENQGKVLIRPSGFPYMSISLSPFNSILRKNNHHTVHELGFDYVAGIVKNFVNKSGDKFETFFLYQGDVIFDNRSCYKILIDYTPYQYISYTVQPNENVTDIAYKFFISDYMIKEISPDIDDYQDVEPGQKIKIPNVYARKTVLYIDKETNLPLVQKMYDEKGLFSQYEFHQLQLNVPFKEEEFRRNYKEYNF